MNNRNIYLKKTIFFLELKLKTGYISLKKKKKKKNRLFELVNANSKQAININYIELWFFCLFIPKDSHF